MRTKEDTADARESLSYLVEAVYDLFQKQRITADERRKLVELARAAWNEGKDHGFQEGTSSS